MAKKIVALNAVWAPELGPRFLDDAAHQLLAVYVVTAWLIAALFAAPSTERGQTNRKDAAWTLLKESAVTV
jgi:hypothetical protein